MTDQMPPGRENQVPQDRYGQPGYPPFGQPAQPGGYPPYGQPGSPGGQPGWGGQPSQAGLPPYPPGYGPGYGQPGLPPYPPGYGPGYGQPGPGGWQAMPAPGGVPLRPLALGDILNGTVTLARRNPAATFGLAAIIATVSGVVSTAVDAIYRSRLASADIRLRQAASLTPQQLGHAYADFFSAFAPIVLVTIALGLVLNAALTGMLSAVIGRGVLGRATGLGDTWRAGRIGPVLGATLLLLGLWIAVVVPVVVAVAVLLLLNLAPVAVLLGVLGWIGTVIFELLLWVRLSVTLPAVVLERVSPVDAIKRSWQLTRGSFWRLFGILLLTWLIVIIATFVFTIPFSLLGSAVGGGSGGLFATAATTSVAALIIGAIGSILAATVTKPIGAGVNVLLYLDLRMRREGLDLALREAAQNQTLTGDEFAAIWRTPAPGQGVPGTWKA